MADHSKSMKVSPSQEGTELSPDKYLPVLPLRDTVLFPGTLVPLLLGRPQTITAMYKAMEDSEHLGFFSLQKNSNDEELHSDSLMSVGTVGRITHASTTSHNLSKIIVEPLFPAEVQSWNKDRNYLTAQVSYFPEFPEKNTQALTQNLTEQFSKYLSQNPDVPIELSSILQGQQSLLEKVYTITSQLKIPATLKQLVLEEPQVQKKTQILIEFLTNEMEMSVLGRQLEHEVRTSISQAQKEFFLGEQLKRLQMEMGKSSTPLHPELKKVQTDIEEANLPDHIHTKTLEELQRLEHIPSSSPEYSVIRSYIDWVLKLPWNNTSTDVTSLNKVLKQLNQDHFGLQKIKDRILEHVAVWKLSGQNKGPILCLIGPPGVGKTSLGASIARALGREFTSIALGGVRDEAEIRGHRRTYIGSMPGKIIQALKKCGTMNPVILLDEVDKLGSDYRGDPSSALLEVLDPEQNGSFTDHYLEIGIDLSQVLFLTTANVQSNIPAPLLDRMEVLPLSGYFLNEKLHIAQEYLIPKVVKRSGLTPEQFDMDEEVLTQLIQLYTREAGVRHLEQRIATLARKRARKALQARKPLPPIQWNEVSKALGPPSNPQKVLQKSAVPGIITGLAWTPVGGDILHIECKLLSGRGRLQLTGKLGEVMKESAQIALTLVRERSNRYGIEPDVLKKTDIHLHVPEGAIPKDGPSAGVAITLAMLSALTRRPIAPNIAFTGEISLTGKVHGVGGLPEKVLAALQAGVTQVFLPADNQAHIAELPQEAKKGLKIEKMEELDKVLRKLLPWK